MRCIYRLIIEQWVRIICCLDDRMILNQDIFSGFFFCSRTFMSIIGGVVAGILGFTGLKGFILYFLVMAFTSVGLIAKTKFSIHSYFDSWNRVLLDGFFGGLMVLPLIPFYLIIIFFMISLISLKSITEIP